jgi:2-oxoglutarate dehydrogenase E1 component
MFSKRLLQRSRLACRAKLQVLYPQLTRGLTLPAGPSPNDPFANGTNTYYAESMYRHWKKDPKSVHVSWDVYFSGLESGLQSSQVFSPTPRHLPVAADGAPALHAGGGAELDDHLKVRFEHLDFFNCTLMLMRPGPTTCTGIPSTRSSRCGIGSTWNS